MKIRFSGRPRRAALFAGLASVCISAPALAQSFTDQTSSSNLGTSGAKDGGIAFVDLNADGCLDVLVNTSSNSSSNRSKLYINNCASTPAFTDKTGDLIAGFTRNLRERSVVAADLNGDGFIDIARNTSFAGVEIYFSDGTATNAGAVGAVSGAGPLYSFGTANQSPDVNITGFAGRGINTEGLSFIDHDGDGDFDLLIDNHSMGMVLMRNDGAGNFTQLSAADSGLPSSNSGTGDYLVTGLLDGDARPDIVGRKGGADIWLFDVSTGRYAIQTFDLSESNSNKGGNTLCDFDNDGDFDLFWSDQGNPANRIWLNDGSGNFTVFGNGVLDSSLSGRNIDHGACADVDLDGDLDLFLTTEGGRDGILLLNDLASTGVLGFTRNNLGITANGDGEAAVFADYDNDGDVDLLVNQDGNNQLWRNENVPAGGSSHDYLVVAPVFERAGGRQTPAFGARVTLRHPLTGAVIAARHVDSGYGHGASGSGRAHFGLPEDGSFYVVQVEYSTGAVSRTCVVPRAMTGFQLVTIADTASDACSAATLDRDGDGIYDYYEDLDGDGDLYNDDTDNDLIPNFLDVDDDGDSVNTIDELPDRNGDGDPTDALNTDTTDRPDYLDTDDDNDGVLTREEDPNGDGDPTNDNTDAAFLGGDLLPNYLDTDDDADGTLTINEPGDADMSGTADALEPCTPDADALACPTGDPDGDGTPNGMDPAPLDPCDPNPNALACDSGDTDMDGLTNGQERAVGTNPNNPDSDGDGVGDLAEVGDVNNPTNTDGDMLINALDADDDGDGVDSLMEDTNGNGDPSDDINMDGVASYLDPCDPDPMNTACGTGDTDGDGTPNDMDPAPLDPCDPNPNALACDSGDTDMDGLSNSVEQTLGTNPNNPDSDGDGVRDDVEVGDVNMPTNTDGDMLIDALDADDDGDGIDTVDEDLDGDSDPTNDNTDAGDGDTTPNYLDADDDGDGKLTEDEDVNGNGDFDDDDTDGDMIPDYLDADDNDGPLGDVDMDGIPNEDEDVDGDGDWTNDDTDMDMIPDFEDPDDDGDGVLTIDEDRDGDGDPTNDNSDEALGDTIPDYLDTDDDGDGVDTRDEDVDMDGDPTNDDTNMDSVPDFLDPCDPDPASAACANGDTDGDGTINSMDPDPLDPCVPNPDALACDSGDTDMDGLPNGTERMLGTDPELQDTDMDGIFDGFEVTDPVAPEDTDMDGDIDALDPDDDGDGVPTLDENADPNGDGNPDDALDSNENGTPDYLDATFPPAPAVGITAPAEGDEVGADFTVTGTANPGDEVAVLIDGAEVGTVTADDEGNWSFDVTGLEPGAHTVEANTEGAAAGPVTVTVVDDMMMDDEVAITAPADGSEVPADFTVSGTANAGAEVTVTIGDAAVGTTTADDDGNWTLDITGQDPGDVTVTATNGDASESVTVTVTDSSMTELEVEITSPSPGSDIEPTFTVAGTATPGAQVTVSIDGEPVGATVAGDDGSWSVDVEDELMPGEYELGATATDGEGTANAVSFLVTVIAVDEFEAYILTGGCQQAPSTPTSPLWLVALSGLALLRRRKR